MVKSYNLCYNHFNFSPVFSTFNFSKISFNSNTAIDVQLSNDKKKERITSVEIENNNFLIHR